MLNPADQDSLIEDDRSLLRSASYVLDLCQTELWDFSPRLLVCVLLFSFNNDIETYYEWLERKKNQ